MSDDADIATIDERSAQRVAAALHVVFPFDDSPVAFRRPARRIAPFIAIAAAVVCVLAVAIVIASRQRDPKTGGQHAAASTKPTSQAVTSTASSAGAVVALTPEQVKLARRVARLEIRSSIPAPDGSPRDPDTVPKITTAWPSNIISVEAAFVSASELYDMGDGLEKPGTTGALVVQVTGSLSVPGGPERDAKGYMNAKAARAYVDQSTGDVYAGSTDPSGTWMTEHPLPNAQRITP